MAAEQHKRCIECEYILDNLTENRCPECGRPFNPDDPHTYGPGDLPGSAYPPAAMLGAGLIGIGIIAIVLSGFAASKSGGLTWVTLLAFLAFWGGVSLEIVMFFVTGWRLMTRRRALKVDRAAYWRAFSISVIALFTLLVFFWLMVRRQ